MSTLPNFCDYKQYKPTESCYLDGRYFNKVFANYPGLIREPLVIKIGNNGINAFMKPTHFDTNYDGVLRVTVEVEGSQVSSGCGKKTLPCARHDMLVLLNCATMTGYLFTSYPSHLDNLIVNVIAKYLGYKIYKVPQKAPLVKNKNCDLSGFCTAYAIKYAYDYLNDQPFDLTRIRSFASRVEGEYPVLRGEADKSYGWLDNPQNRNAVIGGLGGAALGGLVGGPTGLLLGAGIGGLGGYALSGPGGPF